MLLQEVLSDRRPTHVPVDAKLISEQLEAIIVSELWGGLAGLASGAAGAVKAVGAKAKEAGQAVAGAYQQGELKALLSKFDAYKQQLIELIQNNPQAFATESASLDGEVLVELLGGLGGVFGAARDKAAAGVSALGAKAKEAGQAVKGSYARGEAIALLKKIVAVARKLKDMGYKITPQQAREYSQLRRMVGV